MRVIRTGLFYVIWALASVIYLSLIILAGVLPYQLRHRFATYWGDLTIWLARLIVGVRWQVKGRENISDKAVVYAVNHQSTWETTLMPTLQRQQIWVLKKELMHIPFFGWALALLRPIAIDRSQRKKAMEQVIAQGKNRIEAGYSVVMFPEGHRYEAEAPLTFRPGAARLALSLNVPIIPVAHNAGQFWPRRGIMSAGVVQVVIGEPISPVGHSVESLNKAVEEWVRQQRDRLVLDEKARRAAK